QKSEAGLIILWSVVRVLASSHSFDRNGGIKSNRAGVLAWQQTKSSVSVLSVRALLALLRFPDSKPVPARASYRLRARIQRTLKKSPTSSGFATWPRIGRN